MMLTDNEFFDGAVPPVDVGAAGTRDAGSWIGRTDTPFSSNVELFMMHSKSLVSHVVLPQLP